MTESFSSRIEAIIERTDNNLTHVGYLSGKEAVSQILKEIEGIVPHGTTNGNEGGRIWNQFRKQFLENLRGKK